MVCNPVHEPRYTDAEIGKITERRTVMYKYYRENGTWSRPVNMAYLENYFKRNCRDYGSCFEDWLCDMKRNDLIREIYRY